MVVGAEVLGEPDGHRRPAVREPREDVVQPEEPREGGTAIGGPDVGHRGRHRLVGPFEVAEPGVEVATDQQRQRRWQDGQEAGGLASSRLRGEHAEPPGRGGVLEVDADQAQRPGLPDRAADRIVLQTATRRWRSNGSSIAVRSASGSVDRMALPRSSSVCAGGPLRIDGT